MFKISAIAEHLDMEVFLLRLKIRDKTVGIVNWFLVDCLIRTGNKSTDSKVLQVLTGVGIRRKYDKRCV